MVCQALFQNFVYIGMVTCHNKPINMQFKDEKTVEHGTIVL